MNLEEIVKNADIIVSATGKSELIADEWLNQEQVIIDIGIQIKDGKTIGDLDSNRIKEKIAHITPVPGGLPANCCGVNEKSHRPLFEKTMRDDSPRLEFPDDAELIFISDTFGPSSIVGTPTKLLAQLIARKSRQHFLYLATSLMAGLGKNTLTANLYLNLSQFCTKLAICPIYFMYRQ